MKAERILLVEDNRITRKMFRVALEAQGWHVTEAEDGASALSAAKSCKPHLVVSDLTLPDLDGAQLAAQIRQQAGTRDVPIVAVSGFASKLERAKSLSVGFAEHLFKPVDPQQLTEVVRTHLRPRAEVLPGAGLRLLVADDNPVQRRLLKLQLERVGFSVTTAEDGHEALELARATPPDLIVSDVLMPGLDGFRLCHAVRTDPALRDVPVVLVSIAYTEPDDQALARSVGASALVVRGPQHASLIEAVNGCLHREVPPLPATTAPVETEDYTYRVVRQLERQVERRETIANRLALHEAAMSVITQISRTAASSSPVAELIPELLSYALDAAGISSGCVFLLEEGEPLLQAHQGFSPAATEHLGSFFGQLELLHTVIRAGRSRSVPEQDERLAWEQELLTSAGMGSLLLIPIGVGHTRVGVLVLAAAARRMLSECVPLAEAVSAQIGQSVALARSEEALRKTGEQLRHSQKLEAVGRLAGGIAHDFNNLLTVITGYAELATSKLEPGSTVHAQLEQIVRAGRRAASLTRQLLAFSRKQALQPVTLDPNAVVSDMRELLQRLIGEDVELTTSLDTPLGFVRADPSQLEQVIMNLAINARDAMPSGGRLEIKTRSEDLDAATSTNLDLMPGAHVVLEVSDTGCGMDAHTQERVFEPFFTTKEQGKGTGLGLATVFGIVKQSGGHVALSSSPGKGTTFEIYLPRVSKSPSSREARVDGQPTIEKGCETILVVEDTDLVRHLVDSVLTGGGYEVLGFSAPDDALTFLEDAPAQKVDLLLTDIVLPGLGGKQLYERLLVNHPELKVLYMSGYSDPAIVGEQGVLAPDTPFLQKPFSPKDLVAKVRDILDG